MILIFKILSGLNLRNCKVLEGDTATLVKRCRFAMFWCDLDFTYDLAVVTLIFKILSRLYLGKRKEEVNT